MAGIEKIELQHLRSICDLLGDTNEGWLSSSDIGRSLRDCSIDDPAPSLSKRHRLFEALSKKQDEDRCSNNVLKYIRYVMQPVRYHNNADLFRERLEELNALLSYAGYRLNEDGEFSKITAAKTISEAQERAGRLKRILNERQVHPDVLRFCKAELLQENYFHAVFEATKSVADKIREKSGLLDDGSPLVDAAFAFGKTKAPRLAFNTLQSPSEKSEHIGFLNLLKGMFGMFRNVTAHAPKVAWVITEADAIDCLTLTSLLHRKLDKCVLTGL